MAIRDFFSTTLLIAALFTAAAASAAPNPETGAGCAAYGVAETRPVASEEVAFEPTFVKAGRIEDHCGARGRARVRGCYFPDGRAFVVENDDEAYWHEWCHAKFGRRHVRWQAKV